MVQPSKDAGTEGRSNSEIAQGISSFPPLRVGAHVEVERLWKKPNSYGIVIVSDPNCGYCRASGAFDHELLVGAKSKAMPIVLALPRKGKPGKSFASFLGMGSVTVVDWADLGLRVTMTPTVLLVDPKGAVVRYWLGKLDIESEREVTDALNRPSAVSTPLRRLPQGKLMLTETDVESLAKTNPLMIVNIGEREGFDRRLYKVNVINIPLDELRLRAGEELDRRAINVVDCTDLPDVFCEIAIKNLAGEGFDPAAMDSNTQRPTAAGSRDGEQG